MKKASGTAAKPTPTSTAVAVAPRRKVGLRFGLSQPAVWSTLQNAW